MSDWRKARPLIGAVVVILAALVTPAQAGPPDGAKISSQADWVVHIDVAAAVKSKLGRYILDHHDELDIDLGELGAIEEELGVDPLEVILEATVYGDDEEHMVALLRTTDAIDDALRRAESREEATLTRYQQGDAEIYSVHDGEFLFHIMPAGSGGRLLVVSDDAEVLGIGIAAAYGKGETLGERLKVEPIDGGLIYFAATELPVEHDNDDPASMVLRHATAFSGRVAEQGDEVVIDLRLETGNSQDAQNVSDVLQGLIAMGRIVLAEADDADTRQLADVLSGIEVTAAETQIQCLIRQSVESALKALEAAAEEM